MSARAVWCSTSNRSRRAGMTRCLIFPTGYLEVISWSACRLACSSEEPPLIINEAYSAMWLALLGLCKSSVVVYILEVFLYIILW